MTASAPLRISYLRAVAPLHAAAMLVPAVILFCAVLETAEVDLPGTIDLAPQPGLVGHLEYTAKPVFTTLVQEQAEQNCESVAQNIEYQVWPDFYPSSDSYDGLAPFWGDDVISAFFSSIGQFCWKYAAEIMLVIGTAVMVPVIVRRRFLPD